MKLFSEWVRKTRRAREIPLHELANESGLSAGFISELERAPGDLDWSAVDDVKHQIADLLHDDALRGEG